MKSQVEDGVFDFSLIPKQVINSEDKKSQHKIYKKILQRAGLYSNNTSLSCIERLNQPGNQCRNRNEQTRRHIHKQHSNYLWLGAASHRLYNDIESARLHDSYARPIDVNMTSKQNNNPVPVVRQDLKTIQQISMCALEETAFKSKKRGAKKNIKSAKGDSRLSAKALFQLLRHTYANNSVKPARYTSIYFVLNSNTCSGVMVGESLYESPDGSLEQGQIDNSIKDGFGKGEYTNGTLYIGNVSQVLLHRTLLWMNTRVIIVSKVQLLTPLTTPLIFHKNSTSPVATSKTKWPWQGYLRWRIFV